MSNCTEFVRINLFRDLVKGPKTILGYDELSGNYGTVRISQSVDGLVEVEYKFFPLLFQAVEYLDSFRKKSGSQEVLVVTVPNSKVSQPNEIEYDYDNFDHHIEEISGMQIDDGFLFPPKLRNKISRYDL